MTYKEAVKYIQTRSPISSQKSLEQITLLMESLGNPHKQLRYIHIAGTNGKGSVGKMCTDILINSGYTVGTFVSPSVIDFLERFQVNGKMISQADFIRIAEKVIKASDELKWRGYETTQFELITAIGIEYFKESSCDIVCLEVGMGGKLDPTNIIPRPSVAIITAVHLDHVAYLGDTIEEIGYEKSGIMKRDGDVIVYPLMHNDALDMIKERAKFTFAKLNIPDAENVEVEEITAKNTKFSYEGVDYRLGLVGDHQAYNAVIVIESMKVLQRKGFEISPDIIKSTLRSMKFIGRFHLLNLEKYRTTFTKIVKKPANEPIVILDGSHNYHAFEALSNTIVKTHLNLRQNRILVIGMLKDKDIDNSLKSIIPHFNKVICVPVEGNARSRSAEGLAKKAKLLCSEVYAEETLQSGVELAYSLAKDDGLILICGSLHLCTNTLKLYGEGNL